MAYLLDPDSSREVDYGEYWVREELGFANVAQRYLGLSYPYRIIDIYDRAPLDLAAKTLAYDAGLIFALEEESATLKSNELTRLQQR